MLGRAWTGHCPTHTTNGHPLSLWDRQACVPYVGGIPHETVFLLYAMIVALQNGFPGVRPFTLMVGWTLTVVCIVTAVVRLEAWDEWWTVWAGCPFILASCTHARSSQRVFDQLSAGLQGVAAKEREARESKVSAERKLSEKLAGAERKMQAQEALALRSLMGNVVRTSYPCVRRAWWCLYFYWND